MRFNFNQLLCWLRLVGSLRSLLVNEHPNVGDFFCNLLVDIVRHEVVVAFGCLHLKCVPLFTDSCTTMLVFGNRMCQSLNLSLFLRPDSFVLPQPLLRLLFVLLPRKDQTEVFLLQVYDVGAKVLRVLEWKLVGVIGAVFLEELLELVRVLNLVLRGRIVWFHFTLGVGHVGVGGSHLSWYRSIVVKCSPAYASCIVH